MFHAGGSEGEPLKQLPLGLSTYPGHPPEILEAMIIASRTIYVSDFTLLGRLP